MTNSERWLFISPHLDDAVLSCGGLIHQLTSNGTHCTNITITAGIPDKDTSSGLMDEVQSQWEMVDPIEAVKARLLEDISANELLGSIPIHLNNLDLIYRMDDHGHPLYNDIYLPLHSSETNLHKTIANELASYINPADTVIFPLSIGDHIDHVIAYEASKQINAKVLYYIDVPYFFRGNEEYTTRVSAFEKVFFPLDQINVDAWIAAILRYPSQLSSLFKDGRDLITKITEYYSQNRGIILLRSRS